MPKFTRPLNGASLIVLGLCATLAVSGCSSFKLGRDGDGPEAVASVGQRKTIIAFQQKIEPSRSLKGVGYYLPDPEVVTTWPAAGGPQNLTAANFDAAREFKVAWTRSIGSTGPKHASVLAQPVSDGRYIYTLDGEARVTAFDVETGREAWSVNLDPKLHRDKVNFGGGLAYDNGRLFVTSGYRFVTALKADSGEALWTRPVETQFRTAPAVGGGMVFATDVDNQIFAFDMATGELKWTYQALAEPARILRGASAVVSQDLVYAPFSSGELTAIKISTGEAVWSQTLALSTRTNALSEIRDISGHPVISNGVVYAASHSGTFTAITATNGAAKWPKAIAADSVNSPWPAGDVVFLVDLNNQLIVANRDSGQIYWMKELNGASDSTEKRGWFGLGGGRQVARVQWTGPVLASNRLVFVTSEGKLVGLDPKTGDQIAETSLGGAAYLEPIAVGDKLFVVTEDAKLVAIR